MVESILGGTVFLGLFGGLVTFIVLRIKRDVAHVDDIADMRSVPLVRLGEILAEDVVRAAGTVAPADSLLVAPVSGRPCVYYEVVVRLAYDAEPIIASSDICAFDLDDGSGRAYVQPPCPIIIVAERVRDTGAPESVPATLQAWLEENHASDDWREAKRLHWSERRIEPGDRLGLVGFARREVAREGALGGYRDAPSQVVFETDERAPLSLSDDASLVAP